MSTLISLGIDPGWVNLGAASIMVEEDQLVLLNSVTLNPSSMEPPARASTILSSVVPEHDGFIEIDSLTMERYVSYKDKLTPITEDILMLIGGLAECSSQVLGVYPSLLRALDWKKELVKLLVRHKGFDNPSNSLDKQFSIAAAYACLDDLNGKEIKTDHEADAICLAALPLLRRKYAAKTTASINS